MHLTNRSQISNALLTLLIAGAAAGGIAQGKSASYSVVDRFPGPDGGYDYISVDSAAQRVFVGREDGVMTIDLASRKVTPAFVAGEDVAAVLIIPGTPLMLSTNGDANTATLFDRNTGAVRATIPTGKEPDAAQYDERSGTLFVMNGESEDITFIDLKKAAAVATVAVGGKPEAAASDGKGRLYVNIEDKAEIAAIDIASRRLVAHFKLPQCDEPTGLAYDAASHSLISACHNHVAKVIDAGTGADKGTVAIGQGADGAIFDAERRLVYVSCMDGTLWIFPLSRDGKAGEAAKRSTAHGARTEALDVKTGRLYLPRSEYKLGADGERKRVPGTFEVLVVSP